MAEREQASKLINCQHLLQAQYRIKQYADKHRSECHFQENITWCFSNYSLTDKAHFSREKPPNCPHSFMGRLLSYRKLASGLLA